MNTKIILTIAIQFFSLICMTVHAQSINHNMSLPLKSIHVTSGYGMRFHPILHKYCLHNGIDLKADYEPIYSMLPGEVLKVGEDSRSGKYITIRTAYYTISYCHLSVCMVEEGTFVNAGEVIAISGNTGMSTGVHLHITIKKDGKVIDPTILIECIQKLMCAPLDGPT